MTPEHTVCLNIAMMDLLPFFGREGCSGGGPSADLWDGCVSHGGLQGLSDIGLVRRVVQIKAEKLRQRME